MITHLRGRIDTLTPTTVVIECAGVGYQVHISLNAYSALNGQSGEVKLLVSQIIRDDAHLLYGFASEDEREVFALLMSVSGVGPNTARIILSQYTAEEIRSIIAFGQVNALKAVKGIGLKMAQRIVLELQGKLEATPVVPVASAPVPASGGSMALGSSVIQEAVVALKMLGYPETAASKVVRQLAANYPEAEVQTLIKEALKHL